MAKCSITIKKKMVDLFMLKWRAPQDVLLNEKQGAEGTSGILFCSISWSMFTGYI